MSLTSTDFRNLTDDELHDLRDRAADELDRRYTLAAGAEDLELNIAAYLAAGGQVDEIVARARTRAHAVTLVGPPPRTV